MNPYYQKWLNYVAETNRTAEQKRLKHYYGTNENKKMKSEIAKLKKEFMSKYKQLERTTGRLSTEIDKR
ncbi:hypothetical protein C4577_03660 [Candidatus Parcubacteria bacterium]|nr:MAG: hypothetical protein C4577_03660 [Candidatus Parcubacteria bacterium]